MDRIDTKKDDEEPYPEITLTDEQMKEFKACIKEIKPAFTDELKDLKTCNVGKHKIRVLDVPPIYVFYPICQVRFFIKRARGIVKYQKYIYFIVRDDQQHEL